MAKKKPTQEPKAETVVLTDADIKAMRSGAKQLPAPASAAQAVEEAKSAGRGAIRQQTRRRKSSKKLGLTIILITVVGLLLGLVLLKPILLPDQTNNEFNYATPEATNQDDENQQAGNEQEEPTVVAENGSNQGVDDSNIWATAPESNLPAPESNDNATSTFPVQLPKIDLTKITNGKFIKFIDTELSKPLFPVLSAFKGKTKITGDTVVTSLVQLVVIVVLLPVFGLILVIAWKLAKRIVLKRMSDWTGSKVKAVGEKVGETTGSVQSKFEGWFGKGTAGIIIGLSIFFGIASLIVSYFAKDPKIVKASQLVTWLSIAGVIIAIGYVLIRLLEEAWQRIVAFVASIVAAIIELAGFGGIFAIVLIFVLLAMGLVLPEIAQVIKPSTEFMIGAIEAISIVPATLRLFLALGLGVIIYITLRKSAPQRPQAQQGQQRRRGGGHQGGQEQQPTGTD